MTWSDLPGWFNFEDIYDEAVAACPEGGTLVEVGVAFGRSVAYLTRKVMESGKRIQVVAVDPWEGKWVFGPNDAPMQTHMDRYTKDVPGAGAFHAFLGGMREYAPEELERLTVVRLPSVKAAEVFRNCHLVFIDGSHEYADVAADIQAWRQNISATSHGILAGHDYDPVQFPGVVRAVEEAFGEHRKGFSPAQKFNKAYRVQGTSWRWT
jgi:hypothetical protein